MTQLACVTSTQTTPETEHNTFEILTRIVRGLKTTDYMMLVRTNTHVKRSICSRFGVLGTRQWSDHPGAHQWVKGPTRQEVVRGIES
jgi:hypothetical protein